MNNIVNDIAMNIPFNFINYFSCFYKTKQAPIIPKVVLSIIYDYIETKDIMNLLVDHDGVLPPHILYYPWNSLIVAKALGLHRTFVRKQLVLQDICCKTTSIKISSCMNIHAVDRHYRDISAHRTFAAPRDYTNVSATMVLTNKYIYIIPSLNSQIWDSFQRQSNIHQIINSNTKIDRRTAIEIGKSIVNDADIIEKQILPRLIGLTTKQILVNILACQTQMLSLSTLFGLPVYKKYTFIGKIYSSTFTNNDREILHCYGQCEVIDLDSDMFNVIYDMEEQDGRFIVMDCYRKYLCETKSKKEYDQWMSHLLNTDIGRNDSTGTCNCLLM